jgi:hypothetical protein
MNEAPNSWLPAALPPKTVEAAARGAGVVDGVPWFAVAEVVLGESQVVSLVGYREAAGMTQRVRVNAVSG